MAVTYPGATTFPGATLTPGTYSVTTPPVDTTAGTQIVTLAEAKRLCPQTPGSTVEDYEADLTGLIAAVSLHLARQYGAPMPETRTKKVWQQNGTVILPLGCQVVSVASNAVTLTGWDFDADSGLLHGVYSYGQADVTYAVPVLPDVREAVLLVLRHAWDIRYGAQPTGYGTTSDEPYSANPSGFFVPNRAKELLAPYGTRVA